MDSTTGFEVNFKNPKEGGGYKFAFDMDGCERTEFSIILPLAGAEMDGVMKADLLKADAFAVAVTVEYSPRELRYPWNTSRWFWIGGSDDYLGRPDNKTTPTVSFYNQVNDTSGFAAFCTLKGLPVRLTKPSNYILGYAMQQIGISRDTARRLTRPSAINETTDRASVGAGWDIANGGNYGTTVSALVNQIWTSEAENDKVRRVWPNPNAPDNYREPSSNRFNYNLWYGDPGFLYMRK